MSQPSDPAKPPGPASPASMPGPADQAGWPLPVRVEVPAAGHTRSWLVVASPHSGRHYPQALMQASRLGPHALRRSEDAFIDHLFADAPGLGAPLVTSDFARAWVDMNRARDELDPMLVEGVDPLSAGSRTLRVSAGLGVVPRSVGDGAAIYRGRLSLHEAEQRLAEVYDPYHQALEAQLAAARAHHGVSLLLDCHSMPRAAIGAGGPDVVLGDRFGAACSPLVMAIATSVLREAGLSVARNTPYAGGHATGLHGRPVAGSQALQIEICRSLYMVEGALTLKPEFPALRRVMGTLTSALVACAAHPDHVRQFPPLAAE
jgi:N-formylglutamate amidohydrolase